jgi:hypothetical protein
MGSSEWSRGRSLDLLMPVMNGFEAARNLNDVAPDIPLMMFTDFRNGDPPSPVGGHRRHRSEVRRD